MDVLLKVLFLVAPWTCESRIIYSTRQARKSVAEPSVYYDININGVPGTYSFGYDLFDRSGQFRQEEKYPNGTVVGSYGYSDDQGRPHAFMYIADSRGYRVSKYKTPVTPTSRPLSEGEEPSITWTRPKKKKPNKNIAGNPYLTKLPIRKNTLA